MKDFPSKENAIILFIITAFISLSITNIEAEHEYMTIAHKRRFFAALNSVLYTICIFWAWFTRPAHRMDPSEIIQSEKNFPLLVAKKLSKFFLISMTLSLVCAGIMSSM